MLRALRGRGFRQKMLRKIGLGDLYEARRLTTLRASHRLIEIDYPVRPMARHGWDRPPHPQLLALLAAHEDRYRATLQSFLPLQSALRRITLHKTEPGQPHWVNDYFPAFDAISLYGFIATRQPRRLIEIGSGNSTLFARRAIADHGVATGIVSIDPTPRADVDAICDEVMRQPLEDVPLGFFQGVTADDMLFFDGSHRALQNSDATIFFTEIVPMLPVGTLVGVHDSFLPFDYPADWYDRWNSEQYLLAC
jgi:Methyltransferase domain